MPAWARIALGLGGVLVDLLTEHGAALAAGHVTKATEVIKDTFPREPAAREAAGQAASDALPHGPGAP